VGHKIFYLPWEMSVIIFICLFVHFPQIYNYKNWGNVVVVFAIDFVSVNAFAISTFSFLLSLKYPSTTEADFHWPCHFKFSIDTPASAIAVALVARKEWPVYYAELSSCKCSAAN
jgi:hypothetical protein